MGFWFVLSSEKLSNTNAVQFVTDTEEVSEVFGPRYLGIHKVFAPLPTDDQSKLRGRKTMHREELPHGIIGLHALYDDVVSITALVFNEC
jgi:hypothetical protein